MRRGGEVKKIIKNAAQSDRSPFAFANEEGQPTELEIIYYHNGIKYAYGYTFDRNRIYSEYLYHWPNGREALIFLRENGQYEFRENVQEQMTLASRTSENRLYLVSSNEWNCAQTEQPYLWFQKKLYGIWEYSQSEELTLSAVRRGGTLKQKILKEIQLADLGIRDVVITGTKTKPVVSAIHGLTDTEGNEKEYALLTERESMGTQRFFSRIGLWVETLDTGSLLLIDEIESSMHPLLTRHLIEMVQDPQINRNHAQLIFTTHDTGLLDLTLLRRDQIWFAEKNERMETEIYALTEFSPRKGENIAKGYLQGRYGAIPFIGGGGALWGG